MEKAANVSVVEARFTWDDVGTWEALERALPQSSEGNVETGETLVLDTSDSIIVNDARGMVTCAWHERRCRGSHR